VFPASHHSNFRGAGAAGLVLLLALTSGCALFKAESWDLDRFRDERSVDIEHNLSREKPIMANPF
jgi:hypothetical protein